MSLVPFFIQSLLGRHLEMSFPLAGESTDVAAWLRTKSFAEQIIEIFADRDAEAMLGLSETDLVDEVPGREGKRLWALLNSTRSHQGKYRTTTHMPTESLKTCVITLCLGVTINTTSTYVNMAV